VTNPDAGTQPGSDDAGAAGEGLDAQGFPVLPAAAKDVIIVSVSNSNSSLLPQGLYQAPFSANASSANTLSYLDTGFIFTMMPSLQAQFNVSRAIKGGTLSCKTVTDFLLRYASLPRATTRP
jgi:hypothetical protein